MVFLREVLGRSPYESAFVLIVTGLPAEGANVPRITKKPLDQIARRPGYGW